MAGQQQWKGKTAGGNFGQKFLLSALKHIKVKHFYVVLYPIIPFCILFARKGNHAIFNYFHKILGYSKWAAFKGNVRNAFTFGRVVLDKFALLAGRSEQFQVEVHSNELFDQLLLQKKGFIMAGSHIGNFELLGHCLKQDIKPINGIIFGGENKAMQDRRDATFAENHVKLIPVRQDMSHLFAIKDALDNGEIVTILSDRLFGSSKIMTISFLGHDAEFPLSTFRLAAQLEVPVLSVFLMKEKGTRYSGYLIPLDCQSVEGNSTVKAEALLSQYVKSIEDILQKYPEQWFNYYDFWKLENK